MSDVLIVTLLQSNWKVKFPWLCPVFLCAAPTAGIDVSTGLLLQTTCSFLLYFFYSFLVNPVLPNHCSYRGLLFHLAASNDTSTRLDMSSLHDWNSVLTELRCVCVLAVGIDIIQWTFATVNWVRFIPPCLYTDTNNVPSNTTLVCYLYFKYRYMFRHTLSHPTLCTHIKGQWMLYALCY